MTDKGRQAEETAMPQGNRFSKRPIVVLTGASAGFAPLRAFAEAQWRAWDGGPSTGSQYATVPLGSFAVAKVRPVLTTLSAVGLGIALVWWTAQKTVHR